MTTAPPAQVPHTVTAEDTDKAHKAIADLERTERLLTTVLVILGLGGLVFTAVNVTLFAIRHHTNPGIAWMLDPLVSVSLLGVLFIDGKLAAHGYRPNGWPFMLRWFAGLATWLMNCWASLYPDEKFTGWPANPDPAGLLLHSVIPFLVILLAEAGAGYRKFSIRRKAEHRATINAFRDQAEAEARRHRAEAEAERQRAAELAAEAQRAEAEARKAQELADAEARRIRAESEAKTREAEQARLDEEARNRAEAEARDQQARIDRENAEHAAALARENAEHAAALDRQRIRTEAEAAAAKTRAEDNTRAAEQAREDRRRQTETRRVRTAEPAPETTALLPEATAEPTALLPQRPSETTAIPAALLHGRTAIPAAQTRKHTAIPAALPPADTDDVKGAEAKRKQIEEATFEAAVLNAIGIAPTRKDFAAHYGRGETWGRDRYTDAEQQMATDPDFADRVTAEADRRASVLQDSQTDQVPA